MKLTNVMLDGLKAQHDAIDILLARLIQLDPTFLPTQSGKPWEGLVKGNFAIEMAKTLESERASLEEHIATLERYLRHGVGPGSCTRAVLEGDIYGAIVRADPNTRACLGELLVWIVQHMPVESYGSAERVKAWLAVGREDTARSLHEG